MPEQQLVLSSERIQTRITELAAQIATDYRDKDLVLIGVLNGAFIFLADLCRALTIPHQIDFIRVASYGNSTSTSGTVRLSKDIELDLTDKHVLLVEDIVDTGTTLAWLTKRLESRRTASVRVCALINKTERRECAVQVDYRGFELDGFLVGYGLDYAEQYRHLPEIYTLQP